MTGSTPHKDHTAMVVEGLLRRRKLGSIYLNDIRFLEARIRDLEEQFEVLKQAAQEVETLAFRQYVDWMHFHELAMAKPFEAESEAQDFARRVSSLLTIALGADSTIEVLSGDPHISNPASRAGTSSAEGTNEANAAGPGASSPHSGPDIEIIRDAINEAASYVTSEADNQSQWAPIERERQARMAALDDLVEQLEALDDAFCALIAGETNPKLALKRLLEIRGESNPASSPQGNDLWAAWNRCPICEGVDQPGLIHQPSAPYCSQAQNQERDPASEPKEDE